MGTIRPRSAPRKRRRKGSIVVLSAFLLIFLLTFMAFVLDVGYMYIAKAEAQRSADSSALAAAWELTSEESLMGNFDLTYSNARTEAINFAGYNRIAALNPEVYRNSQNDSNGEIVIGRLTNPSDLSEQLSFDDSTKYNAVQVTVKRTQNHNGPVPLFFARMLGYNDADISATATAVFNDSVNGFRVTEQSGNASLLPYALHIDDWNEMIAGGGDDNFAFDPTDGTVSEGFDGIREVRLFPGGEGESGNGNGNGNGNGKNKGNGNNGNGQGGNQITSGNWGTVNIGASGNSAATLRRLIEFGPNADDLSYYENNTIKLDEVTGTLELNGDTGITASQKHALAEIIGQPRTIFLYESASGQGNNTTFVIVGFAGVRVVDYNFTGNDKYVLVQPAIVTDPTAVVGPDGSESRFVGQPVHLVR